VTAPRGVPPELAGAYGQVIGEPVCHATFLNPDGSEILTTTVTGGTYTNRSDRWPREEASITIAPALTPSQTSSPVSPYGGTVRLSIGSRVGGVERTFVLATLDVTETAVKRPEGTVTVRAVSREARVNEDRYTTRSATSAGDTSGVVSGLLRRTLSNVPVANRLTNDPAVPAGAFPLDGDVWPTIEAMMNEADGECLFDPLGSVVLRDEPVRVSSPVVTFRTGETGPGTLTGYESIRGWAFNRVAVIYEEQKGTAIARVRGLWEDTTSQSGVNTPYGRHTYVQVIAVDEGELPTQARADAAARSLATRRQSGYRVAQLRAVPAPWVRPGDTVGVEFLGGLSERLLVVGVSFPLEQNDVMTLDTRDPNYTAT
jgi:hypothetical protein